MQTGSVIFQPWTQRELKRKVRIMDRKTIADIVSPEVPITTNSKGGSQSDIPVRFDLIDGKALFEMAKVLDYGAKKYGENNWRKIEIDDHLNHLLMHTYAYLAGDRTDEHLSHILCRATFALGVALQETEDDSNHYINSMNQTSWEDWAVKYLEELPKEYLSVAGEKLVQAIKTRKKMDDDSYSI
jgi:hypothetical protein